MRVRRGLTTWNAALGRVGLSWRWNMPLGEAVRTFELRRYRGRGHGYAAAGPLILEW